MYISDEELHEERTAEKMGRWWPLPGLIAMASAAYFLYTARETHTLNALSICAIGLFLVSLAVAQALGKSLARIRSDQHKRLTWYDDNCRQGATTANDSKPAS